MKQLLLASSLLLAAPALAHGDGHDSHEDFTLIHAGTVLPVPGERPLTEQTIIITDGTIVGIEAGYLDDDEATIIDGRDMFFLPGLIDSHVHLRSDRATGKPDDVVRLEAGDVALQPAAHRRS